MSWPRPSALWKASWLRSSGPVALPTGNPPVSSSSLHELGGSILPCPGASLDTRPPGREILPPPHGADAAQPSHRTVVCGLSSLHRPQHPIGAPPEWEVEGEQGGATATAAPKKGDTKRHSAAGRSYPQRWEEWGPCEWGRRSPRCAACSTWGPRARSCGGESCSGRAPPAAPRPHGLPHPTPIAAPERRRQRGTRAGRRALHHSFHARAAGRPPLPQTLPRP